jgi:glycosyltransferase involved in cell wall biosynthesis
MTHFNSAQHKRGTCPCTALTFTRNSADMLEECLKSGQFAAQHLILDGGSTDGTLELAAQYGCSVIEQDKRLLNEEGRIIDYGNITNQGINAAQYPWITIIDSDEHLDQEVIDEMSRIVSEEQPGAYNVNRIYTYHGHPIKYASTYPNYQIRLFHKEAITKFIKVVHERPELRPGIKAQVLPGVQYVPLIPLLELKQKFTRYLPLEAQHAGKKSWLQWVLFTIDKILRLDMRLLRIIRGRLLHRWKDCLPLKYEFLYFWYAWAIIWRVCPLFFKKNSR